MLDFVKTIGFDNSLHVHALMPDGVFLETDQGYLFCRQSALTHEELTQLASKIRTKGLKCIEQGGEALIIDNFLRPSESPSTVIYF